MVVFVVLLQRAEGQWSPLEVIDGRGKTKKQQDEDKTVFIKSLILELIQEKTVGRCGGCRQEEMTEND